MKLWSVLLCVSAAWGSGTYYVDCQAGNDAADGRSPANAWRSVGVVSTHEFAAGDSILFRRGTLCKGTLQPKGSGTAEAPVVISTWGEGPLPQILAEPGAEAALRLFDQEYWTIQHLDLSGGQPHGIFVSGTHGVLHGIHIRQVIVHGVTGEPKSKEGGLVVIAPGSAAQRFDDVLVEGVTAYGTSQWAGILVGSLVYGFLPEQARSTNVVVRDCMVHNVAGDGIVLFQVNRGVIENSVAWYTGMQETQTIGTPNGIWTWMCPQCAVRRSEAFLTDSPGVDGGAFDIDYGDDDNVVEQSYGHDTQGYCIAIFGAGQVTTNSMVRANVCAGNGRSPRLAAHEGAVFLATWNGGRLKGVEFSHNRIFWDPPIAAPAIVNTAEMEGAVPKFDGNLIAEQAGPSQDATPPVPLPSLQLPGAASRPAGWRLLGLVSQSGEGVAILASAYRQFHAAGLHAILIVPRGNPEQDHNLHWDWNLDDIAVAFDDGAARNALHVSKVPAVLLVNPAGQIVWRHDGPLPPGDLGLALRRYLGNPDYAQLVSETLRKP